MKQKGYYLAGCSTCQRIIKELGIEESFELQDIKSQAITQEQLDEMANLSGSYESLFSRRAIKYRTMGLKDQQLSESDYRDLILKEYTFLKRPVFVMENQIFVGSAKKTVEALKQLLLG